MKAPLDGKNIYPMARGIFAMVFDNIEDTNTICEVGLWIWCSASLFMQPWTPTFDPVMTSISTTPIWVTLLNIPLHFWNLTSLSTIGYALRKFYRHCIK